MSPPLRLSRASSRCGCVGVWVWVWVCGCGCGCGCVSATQALESQLTGGVDPWRESFFPLLTQEVSEVVWTGTSVRYWLTYARSY